MGEENLAEFQVTCEGEVPLRAYLGVQREYLRAATAAGIIAALATILPDVDRPY